MGRTKQSSSSSFWSSRRRTSSAPATPRPEPPADPPIGCMSMVHYLIFAPGAGCVGRPPASSNAAVVTPHGFLSPRREDGSGGNGKSGFEAPRNSLDLDDDNPNDIQIGVQIEPVFDALARTKMRRPKPTAPSSEAETPRTPSLVARLMGIDGLPDSQQPSPSDKKQHPAGRHSSSKKQHAAAAAANNKENHHCFSAPASAGNGAKAAAEKKKRVIPESMNREPLRSLSCNVGDARSLPDTPRASSSARASWDGPRLSLQALKESVLDRAAQYMSMPSSPTSSSAGKKKNSRRRRDEIRERERVAKEHAREILRQAKENVASRNKSSSSKSSKSKSSSPAAEKRHSVFSNNKENVPTSPAAAPAVEDKPMVAAAKAQQGTTAEQHPPSQSPCRVPLAPRQTPPPHRAKPSRPPPPPPPLDPPTRARKPDGCERFATRIKQKPAAAGGHGQASPGSSASSSPVALPPAPPASSSLGHHHQQRRPAAVPLEEDPEYSYLRMVLERGGFMRSPPRRPFKGHSVSSPVDPIVFHLLELELPAEDESRLGPLRHRWNRKLLFHLAQEVLADLLLGLDAPPPPHGPALLGKVWRRVRSFPAADCRVMGDVDALVAADLGAARVRRLARHPAVAEEAGDVAEQVAEMVLEALLGECLAAAAEESAGSLWFPDFLSPPACAGHAASSRAQAR